MLTINLQHEADFAGWRTHARALLYANVQPADILWQIADTSPDLFASDADTLSQQVMPLSGQPTDKNRQYVVPRNFIDLAEKVICHRNEIRFGLLYKTLWRMTHGERSLLQRITDDDVHTLLGFAKAVSRDRHKMTAFVRFRKTPSIEHEHYSAWFEPTHYILRLTSDFFRKRFTNMDWSIFTPEGTAHWNRSTLVFADPGTRQDVPDTEVMEELWCTYFSSIFNPARLRLNAMQAEMPVKYWKNLPEAPVIAQLTRESESRTRQMVEAKPSEEPRYLPAALHRARVEIPVSGSLHELQVHVRDCKLCAHACDATQAVPGQGRESARVMIVGEQPGDNEDLQGRPFVGPAGILLRSILNEHALDEKDVYLTNAVKHFKYSVRGKRRLHQTPDVSDIKHCRSWLFEEIALVNPEVIIALGSSATRSLLGKTAQFRECRGTMRRWGNGSEIMVTHHPARILRSSDVSEAKQLREQLSTDIDNAFKLLVSV